MSKLRFSFLLLLLPVLASCHNHYTHLVDTLKPVALTVGNSSGQFIDRTGESDVWFLVFGDSGSGSENQERLAKEMQSACKAAPGGCDFALVLGDNIYENGVKQVDDLKKRFETPYSVFDRLDFWLVPGNHDWRSPESVQNEIQHTAASMRWRMPSNHYRVPGLPQWLNIYGLDTTVIEDEIARPKGRGQILASNRQAQIEGAEKALCGAPGWRVLFGHHAVYSGGQHGGSDGILEEQAMRVLPLIEKCGVQVYLAGHDHHQELIQATRFTQVIEGAGGKETRSVTMRSAAGFKSEWAASEYGFALVHATPKTMDIQFHTCGKSRVGMCSKNKEAPVKQ